MTREKAQSGPSVTIERRGRAGAVVSAAQARALARAAAKLLVVAGRPQASLAISLVDDAEIHALNRMYRDTDGATDVLSFSLVEGDAVRGDAFALGDVVISVETAARRKKRGLEGELLHLLTHGICHLCGLDHATPAEARVMFAEERRLRAAARLPETR